ncbi:MFS general substrate transporter [Ganoderma sinense ZZ0214-1]|uniref:MFS general substrate transporter n=1 Tax=Ganoderma sinense ZZ0214-1 TaxID=1077348 RepID=A0A2G8S4B8_9APHY|nr:MFS general substrate transporter [Ganoderma sinense ZZ0214-1]
MPTFLSQFKIYNGTFSDESIWTIFLRPFPFLLSPVTWFNFIGFSMPIVLVDVVALCSATIYTITYHFDASEIGLTGVSNFVGIIPAVIVAGPLSDRWIVWMSQRNRGIYEPEFRLLFMQGMLFCVFGLVGWGIGYEHHVAWIGAVGCGVMISFGTIVSGATVLAYVIDTHGTNAFHVLTLNAFARSMIAYAMTFFVNGLVLSAGVKLCLLVLAALQAGCWLSWIPMYVYGKRARSFIARHPRLFRRDLPVLDSDSGDSMPSVPSLGPGSRPDSGSKGIESTGRGEVEGPSVPRKWSGSSHIPSALQNMIEQSMMHTYGLIITYPNASDSGVVPSSTPSQTLANSANTTVCGGPGGFALAGICRVDPVREVMQTRLLDTHTEQFVEKDPADNDTRYAILSHTWDQTGEQTYKQPEKIQKRHTLSILTSLISRLGSIWSDADLSPKIRDACAEAFRYIWIDSCCIDKTSSSELPDAVNLMHACKDGSSFNKSRWFARGWTPQELLAPPYLLLLPQDWKLLGSKLALVVLVHRTTNISPEALLEPQSLDKFSVAQRLSWAAKRKTTRVEARAYALLGIFNINMPILYGERARAFRRQEEEILETQPWHVQSLLAPSLDRFAHGGLISTVPHEDVFQRLPGARLRLPAPDYAFSL